MMFGLCSLGIGLGRTGEGEGLGAFRALSSWISVDDTVC
jgi:hypothetical protein